MIHFQYPISKYSIKSNRTYVLISFWLFIVFIIFFSCSKNKKVNKDLFYLNHNDTVDYVGMSTCASCHQEIAKSFLHTGMGSSFDLATHQKSSADFSNNPIVYDTINDLFYKPFWKDEKLYFMEFRIQGKDTIHKRIEKIDFIIGSGQHTNSHLILRNGFVYQAPLTWYSQHQHWALPPGFEKGKNSMYKRMIDDECMSCHNSLPTMEDQDHKKFINIGKGIDCERCHGPGELHVKLRAKGKTIKSKDGIDRTIINPSKLSWKLQIDLCQRCHLQGNAVLKDGKRFTEFKPGMKLSDFFEVYMPNYENNKAEMIMASHAQRLQLSKCYIKSNNTKNTLKLTCINCHNPHISVKSTTINVFNNACNKCHGASNNCTVAADILKKKDYNCVSCHMPGSGTSDIPHVMIHDHYIKIPNKKSETNKGALKGLYCINNDSPTSKSSIKAYLSYYEKFDSKALYLIEARKLLDKTNDPFLEIYYWYLKENGKKVINFSKQINIKDAGSWDLYRIGQSYLNEFNWKDGEKYIRLAIKLEPKNFEFIYKLSVIQHHAGQILAEEATLLKVINLNPNHTEALNNLGFLYFERKLSPLAYSYYSRSLKTNPDFLPVLKNLYDYYRFNNNDQKAILVAKQILKKEPTNKFLLDYIKLKT